MNRFKHPFTCLISGPSGCGKTVFCVRFLKHLDSLCIETTFEDIIWCFSENAAVPREQLAGAAAEARISYHQGVLDFDNTHNRPKLIILDDLLNEVYSKDVCELFTKGSHHRNISVILITQNLFHQGRFCRDISLNAKYLVVFKNVRDKNQFAYLARQVYPENSKSLYESYLDATRRPHGYLLLDLAQDTDDLLRFRTAIFPSEITVVYAPLKDNEEDTVELPYPTGAEICEPETAQSDTRDLE